MVDRPFKSMTMSFITVRMLSGKDVPSVHREADGVDVVSKTAFMGGNLQLVLVNINVLVMINRKDNGYKYCGTRV